MNQLDGRELIRIKRGTCLKRHEHDGYEIYSIEWDVHAAFTWFAADVLTYPVLTRGSQNCSAVIGLPTRCRRALQNVVD